MGLVIRYRSEAVAVVFSFNNESKTHGLISICTKPRKSFSCKTLCMDKSSGIDNIKMKNEIFELVYIYVHEILIRMNSNQDVLDYIHTGCKYLVLPTGVLAGIMTSMNNGANEAGVLVLWILFGISLAGVILLQLLKMLVDKKTNEPSSTEQNATYYIVPA